MKIKPTHWSENGINYIYFSNIDYENGEMVDKFYIEHNDVTYRLTIKLQGTFEDEPNKGFALTEISDLRFKLKNDETDQLIMDDKTLPSDIKNFFKYLRMIYIGLASGRIRRQIDEDYNNYVDEYYQMLFEKLNSLYDSNRSKFKNKEPAVNHLIFADSYKQIEEECQNLYEYSKYEDVEYLFVVTHVVEKRNKIICKAVPLSLFLERKNCKSEYLIKLKDTHFICKV